MLRLISESVRPVLTYFGFLVYIITLTLGVFMGHLSWSIYVAQVGGLVSIMIGFWFGERSALKNPKAE